MALRLSPRPFARPYALKLSAIQARKDAEQRSKKEQEEGERLGGRPAKRVKLNHASPQTPRIHTHTHAHAPLTTP